MLLQRYEDEEIKLKKRIEELKKELPIAKEINKLEKELEELQSAVANKQKEVKHLMLESKSLDEKYNSLQDSLYGGKYSSPKEIAQQGKKLKELEKQREKLDDTILKKEEEIEKLRNKLKELEIQFKDKLNQNKEIQRNAEEEVEEIEKRLASLKEKNSTLLQQIESKLLEEYHNLKKHKGGQAIVSLKKNICTGCQMALPAAVVSRVKEKMEIVHCIHCGRILFYEEEFSKETGER